MTALLKLNGYQGLAMGLTLEDGKHVIVVASDAATLEQFFSKTKRLPNEKFNPTLTLKAVVIVKDLTAQ